MATTPTTLPTTLTDDIDQADTAPGHAAKHVRLKYAHPCEMLDEFLDANGRIGRMTCPVCDYIEAHLGDDVIEVERFIYTHPDWGPPVLCESIRGTVRYNNAATHPHGEAIAEAVQYDLSLALTAHPFAAARQPLAELLRHPETRFVSPRALYVLLAYLNANHPNPRRVLERPEVRAKLPADLPIERFPAPDFAPA